MAGQKVTASIVADGEGIVAETAAVTKAGLDLGLTLERIVDEGGPVKPGEEILRFHGTPKQVVMAEERLIGLMAKPSGIATAARDFVKKAGPRPKIVCGAWKKMPLSLKDTVRRAVITGGASYRISDGPFIYLDKNYIQLLGGIKSSLRAVHHLKGYLKVIQLKGRYRSIADEACEAAEYGADVLFIDTGELRDLKSVAERFLHEGLRARVKIAFGGGIRLEDLDALKAQDVDVLDIGRQIVDAPLLDMRLEVLAPQQGRKE